MRPLIMSDPKAPDLYIVTSRPWVEVTATQSPTYTFENAEGQRVHVADRDALQRAISAAMKDRKLAG